MKKLLLLCLFGVFMFTSCGNIRSVAAVENRCPKSEVKIINVHRGYGARTYDLSVCGERMIYKRSGSVYFRVDETDKNTGRR
ncbi:PBP1b-binding outer membrane lipoprotein LpoB [Parabacteroides sp. PF5-5]|uniref:hypothetical protein n=1 Tax=unclassified Parabacteroides TaxID=2649774 RepID=UPI0024733EA6|nr:MULTISPECIES: hypothetical protein [unclassified Parabacteroides]MDH6305184.1 PBP1b-binding outer membrane lipoprotein LpoB [Parabacteroides sp. PH5-39]MDH6316534.1 PBP1b-binding outer membrane lipoprotein LpoB [Parabacteroides sp. PF5-13]MDH6320044.1 PBP1b-binding outer membrane lipoprotein LpoB [Parabacteroides sp. PH5-13]MDH6323723.1 PBP1b-binding outer membrane lipoprotein LpoB [Parabacteroides sp. PH5-8]MDH6327721.1 PBP1b-binding outer membrane lipoprotein LpoB [Parabacteroides sp. PH5